MVFSNGSRFAKSFLEFQKTLIFIYSTSGRKKCFEKAYMCMHPKVRAHSQSCKHPTSLLFK